MPANETPTDQGEFLLYKVQDGTVKIEVCFQQETVWLTQKALADLFEVKVPAINKHLKNIFESGELYKDSVISILETTATDNKNYRSQYYNLDAIIAVGFSLDYIISFKLIAMLSFINPRQPIR